MKAQKPQLSITRSSEPADPLNAQQLLQVVISDTFESIIMIIILLNVACLAMNYVGMPSELIKALFWLNLVFAVIFVLEVVAKLIGLGFKQYFRDRWCIFDCIVAVLSVIQIAIDMLAKSDIPAVNLLRVFRVVRIFRLVPKVRN
jgi:voltage-gated sodium channel